MWHSLPKKTQNGLLLTGLMLNLLVYTLLALAGDIRLQMTGVLLLLALNFFIYLFILRYFNGQNWLLILAIAVLSRLVFFFSDPVLSDDVHRYLWNGRVFSSGLNPYALPPQDAALQHLRDAEIYPKVSHPEIPSVYAPVAQVVFAANAFLGNTLFGWRLILLLFEALLVFILWRLLRHFRLPDRRLLLWLLNPLVILETYYSAHLEIIGVSLFVLALYYFFKYEPLRANLAFASAALVKFTPLVFLLPFLKRRTLQNGLIIIGLFLLALLPFALGGTIPMSGFISFANRWEFNGAAFKVFSGLIDSFEWKHEELFHYFYNGHLEYFYLNGAQIYKAVAALILVVVIIDQWQKLKATQRFHSIVYLRASMTICGTLLLLSPTLYPWYVLWMLPFLLFVPNMAWLIFSGLILLSYHVLQGMAEQGIWKQQWWILLLEYIPFYLLLIFEYRDKRRITGWWGSTQYEINEGGDK